MKIPLALLGAFVSYAAVADEVRPVLETLAPSVKREISPMGPDGTFNYLHDNAIFAFKGRLFAAWYNCPRAEMVGTSLIRGKWSDDDGRTWSEVKVFADNSDGKMRVPPAFGSDGKDLYLFASQMTGVDVVVDCEIYRWDAARESFASVGLMGAKFLPNTAMSRRTDGRWMIGGRRVVVGKKPGRPCLAVSETADPAGKWMMKDIAEERVPDAAGQTWGCPEVALVAEGRNLTAYVRVQDRKDTAGLGHRVFVSSDEGETWRLTAPLPFALEPAKPAAGILSDGRRYLIANPRAEKRNALAIWLAPRGSTEFTEAYYLQRGDSAAMQCGKDWCYPSVIEHKGELYVITSTRSFREATPRDSSGLTIVPIAKLGQRASVVPARTCGLTVNRLHAPFGVCGNPTFAWKMASTHFGIGQREAKLELFRGDSTEPCWSKACGTASNAVAYDGPGLADAAHYRWRVTVTTSEGDVLEPVEATFSTGLSDPSVWKRESFVTVSDPRRDGEPDTTVVVKAIANPKEVREVWWFTTGLGVYQAFANGCEVLAEARLKPGYTTLEQRRHYFSADITELVRRGKGETNVFCGEVVSTWWTRMEPWTLPVKENAFAGVLVFRYADGTEERISTDATWQAAFAGPVVSASLFQGEVYDARVGTPWRTEGAPAEWKSARPTQQGWAIGQVTPLVGPPVCLRLDLKHGSADHYVWKDVKGATSNDYGKVVRFKSLKIAPGEELVFDFWQNHAAVPEMVWKGAAGTRATLRFAEMLNDRNGEKARGNDGPGGSLYLKNLRSARAGLEYVFAGKGEETYVPERTFFGFRYMSVRADGPIEVVSAQAIPVCSIDRSSEGGSVETGDAGVNKLVQNILWGQRSNYLSVPTDCPQRDERQGWSADTQVFASAGAFNADTYGFLSKWMEDLTDSIEPTTGSFPFVAPFPRAKDGHLGPSTGWSDAGIVVPHVLYRMFGDPTVLARSYPAMERFLSVVFPDPITKKPCPDFGDWLSPEANNDELKHLISQAYLVWDSQMMQDAARALGRDSARYVQMEARARADFRRLYMDADGDLIEPCRHQTGYAFVVWLDLAEGEARAKAKSALVRSVKERGCRLGTGFLGTPVLLYALVKADAADLAYEVLTQHGYPSWLYSVDQGATTVWERWNSYTKEKGFGDASMNSFNHYAYGCVLAWIYEDAAGIRYDMACPGYRHFSLTPHPNARLGFLKAAFESPYGKIASAWTCEKDGSVRYAFTIPPGTSATLSLPDGTVRELTAGSYAFSHSP